MKWVKSENAKTEFGLANGQIIPFAIFLPLKIIFYLQPFYLE